MCDPLDQRIHKFYAKLGFLPVYSAILAGRVGICGCTILAKDPL